jgi:spore coat protein U-like protein
MERSRRTFGYGLALAIAAATALAPSAAGAQACQLTSVSPIAFGTYDPTSSSEHRITGTLSYRCPVNRAFRISLDRGNVASFAPRAMWLNGADPTEVLQYLLCLDLQCTEIWGDGSPGTLELQRTANGHPLRETVTVYGTILPLQDALVGSYSDVVPVTVNF